MGKDKRGRNLGKGVRQRQNGKFEARFVDSRGVRKSFYSDTAAGAKRAMAAYMAEDSMGTLPGAEYTLDEWFQVWFQTFKSGRLRESSENFYTLVYRLSISPYLGRMMLTDIKKSNVQETINRAIRDGYGYARQDKVRRIMHDMMQRAVEDELLIRNPVVGCRLTTEKPDERRVLTRDEQELFLEAAKGDWYEDLFITALNTGLRPGELYALVPDDIDLASKVVHVRHTLHYACPRGGAKKEFYLGPPKTRQSARDVPLNTSAARALARQMERKAEVSRRFPGRGPYIFVTGKNGPMCAQMGRQAIDHVLAIVNEGRGESERMPGLYPHAFRHTFATRCLEAGIPPKVVQAYLGHASLQMTMDLYTHVTEAFQAEQIERL